MERWEIDEIRSRNNDLRDQVNDLEAAFERQQAELGNAGRKLAKMKVHVTSADRLVQVTANSAGVIINVQLAADACRVSTPDKLSRSINEAIAAAVSSAAQATAQVLAPITEVTEQMPDLDELIPGAPRLKDLRAQLFPMPSPEPPKQ